MFFFISVLDKFLRTVFNLCLDKFLVTRAQHCFWFHCGIGFVFVADQAYNRIEICFVKHESPIKEATSCTCVHGGSISRRELVQTNTDDLSTPHRRSDVPMVLPLHETLLKTRRSTTTLLGQFFSLSTASNASQTQASVVLLRYPYTT